MALQMITVASCTTRVFSLTHSPHFFLAICPRLENGLYMLVYYSSITPRLVITREAPPGGGKNLACFSLAHFIGRPFPARMIRKNMNSTVHRC